MRLTMKQMAVVAGFPADYPFDRRPSYASKQFGNAVPPLLAEAVARSVVAALGEPLG
jgi:DNA (cytosine-5)-methyltransferase 1